MVQVAACAATLEFGRHGNDSALIPVPYCLKEIRMNQQDVESFVASLENVQKSEAYGYLFYFYSDDHRMPFLTIANSDNDYDKVSNLNREGVFRVNLGIRKETFAELFPNNPEGGDVTYDFTILNTFLPHPDYAKQYFICILNPSEANEDTFRKLVREAHEVAKQRYDRKNRSEGIAD